MTHACFGTSQMYYDMQGKGLPMIKICVTILENMCSFLHNRLQKQENGYKKRKTRSKRRKVATTTCFLFDRVK